MTRTGVELAEGPDDSGTEAFHRFGYQAHVLWPFVLQMITAQDSSVLAVYTEHFEDGLVIERDGLLFVAIKSRDPGRRPWRLSDLVNNGAFGSLLRTHRALTELGEGRPVRYLICLEGGSDPSDENLASLVGSNVEVTEECIGTVVAGLIGTGDSKEEMGTAAVEIRTILAATRVRDNVPGRKVIRNYNVSDLATCAPLVPLSEARDIYDKAIAIIKEAMEGAKLEGDWPGMVLQSPPNGAPAPEIDAKRMDRDRMSIVFDRLLRRGDTLKNIPSPELPDATNLVKKLVAAGADADLVELAKQLRGNAALRIARLRSGSLEEPEALVVDLDARVLTMAITAQQGASDAGEIWKAAMHLATSTPDQWDPQRLLARDGPVIVGHLRADSTAGSKPPEAREGTTRVSN